MSPAKPIADIQKQLISAKTVQPVKD